MSTRRESELDRRDFLKAGATAGLVTALGNLGASVPRAMAATQARLEFKVPPIDPVRIGYVGVGGMGSAHVRNLLRIEGVEIRAVCDIVSEKVARVQKWVVEAGQKEPEGYTRGPWDFRRLCERPDLDLVYN